MARQPVDPNMARSQWVEAERIRRAEALVQRDHPTVCAARLHQANAEAARWSRGPYGARRG